MCAVTDKRKVGKGGQVDVLTEGRRQRGQQDTHHTRYHCFYLLFPREVYSLSNYYRLQQMPAEQLCGWLLHILKVDLCPYPYIGRCVLRVPN